MKIGLLGHGVVGSGVSNILADLDGLEVVRILVKTQEEVLNSMMTTSADEIIDDPQIDTVVECMGGIEPAHTFVKRALESGKSVVTSNKKMLASCYSELSDIAKEKGVSIRCEACVGGGVPWIHELKRIRRVDRISSFEGIFNGTTNYILSKMTEDGADFKAVLAEAQKLGYAEKDPTDDVDGFDARYKLLLSLAAAFSVTADIDSIPRYGIGAITAEDIARAKQNGYTVKLIARASLEDGKLAASVMPTFVKNTDPLSFVSANYNAMRVESTTLGKSMYYGQGAGSLPTAHAMVQDLLSLDEPNDTVAAKLPIRRDIEETYYIRGVQSEKLEKAALRQVGNAVTTKKITVSELEDILSGEDMSRVFVAEIAEYEF